MNRFWTSLLLPLVAVGCINSSMTRNQTANALKPPVAEKKPKVDAVHGLQRVDDYFWLRDKTNPAVAVYLEAENAYTDAVMAPTKALQEKLYQEMLSHIKETDSSAPYRKGEYWYYSRTEEGKQYRIHCRRKASLEAPEELTLELNEMAKGLDFLSIGAYEVSEDGHLLAFSTDTTGFREYTLQVKDLRTGKILPDRIEKTGSVAWAADNRTLFYTVEDATKRHYRIYKHVLGSSDPDPLVFQEDDERFNLSVSRARSDRFLFMTSGSHTTSEVRFLDATDPNGIWQLVQPREQDHEYYLDHHGDFFYIRTNQKGRNFSLAKTPIKTPSKEHWMEVVPHRPEVMLDEALLFANHFVLFEREGGLPYLRVTSLQNGESYRISVPEPAYTVAPYANAEFNTRLFRYSYESLVTPDSVFEIDMDTRETKLIKQIEVPGGFDSSRYRSERLFAAAPDGTQIPISLVYRKDLNPKGRNPLLLVGYGAYGFPYDISFSSVRLSLLDRGVVYAIAHIRGGGDMGKPWHDQGRMHNKKNTFTDFIACASDLIARQYTSPNKLAISGGSAGGLLMGAVVNMRPDLFKAVVSHVPFVDVINTMLDETLPLTVGEFEEWGNPKNKSDYDYMVSYCPYSNLEPKTYPSMLIKTSFNDSQVMYWEPAKYVAKLRTLKTDRHPLLLKTNMAAGHGGASGRYDHLREVALDYAFTLQELGLSK